MSSRLSLLVITGALLAALLLVPGCALMQEVTRAVKPTVSVEGVHFADLSFEALSLVVDTKIHNPNSVAIPLTSFDYNLGLNNLSVVSGNQESKLTIAANGESKLPIPLKIKFLDLYKLIPALKGADTTGYKAELGLSFEVPGLGRVRMPLVKEGTLPLLKIPDVKVSHLKLKKFDLSGAELELDLGVKNNNGFDMLLDKMNYELVVNDVSWAKGGIGQPITIKQKDKASVNIPISLDFKQLGSGVLQLLAGGGKSLKYGLKGNMNLKPSYPGLGDLAFPLDKSGELDLIK